jgi:hypothetical protein
VLRLVPTVVLGVFTTVANRNANPACKPGANRFANHGADRARYSLSLPDSSW